MSHTVERRRVRPVLAPRGPQWCDGDRRRTTRLGMLALVSMLLVGLLGTRLWFLQGVEAASFQAKVSAAKLRDGLIPPERGRIFDAKGRIMADNQQILTVAIDWSVVNKPKNRQRLFERLSGPLKVPVIELQRRYNPCFGEPAIPKCNKGQRYSPLLPLPLKEDVDEDTVNYLKERSEDYPGIQRRAVEAGVSVRATGQSRRRLHGRDHRGDQEGVQSQGYNTDERVGQFGVEQSMEAALHGSWGKKVYEIDAAGDIVGEARPGGRPGRRPGHPAEHRPRRAAVRRAGVADQARATATCPGPRRCHDVAAHNPVDPKNRTTTRVYCQLEGVRHPGVDPVQGARRRGGGRGQLHRPDPGDGQLPDVRQPLAGRRRG